MRFNDLIETVLTGPSMGGSAPVTRWRQCVDLLAQYDRSASSAAHEQLSAQAIERVLKAMADLAPRLTIAQRLASVVELGPKIESPHLARLFASDHSAICSAAMARAQIGDDEFARLVPMLGPLARSVLRRRNDLGTATRAMLAQFGSIDLGLPSAAPASIAAQEAAPLEPVQSDIARIVERIEAFTSSRPARPKDSVAGLASPLSSPQRAGAQAFTFRFETDNFGVIQQVDGAPAASIIGLTIAASAVDGLSGPDGQLLGAFRRRASVRDARYRIASGSMAGDWRITAEPRFDAVLGRFLGYSGEARRAADHEVSPIVPGISPLDAAAVTPSSARQLVHELRSPLNAIQGFAEIIDQQLMGPVPEAYRSMARRILDDAARLLGLFDDLDLASRIARGDDHRREGPVDLHMLMGQVLADMAAPSDPDLRMIELEVENDLPPALVDQIQAQRMIVHLLRIVQASLATHERVPARLARSGDGVALSITRPSVLLGLSETALLDPATSLDHDEPHGPPLGIAFGLRLVRNLAQHAGGGLDLNAGQFVLRLPTSTATRGEGRRV
jgi:signal transduction histidine kinase